jgi:hypothetical protein
MPATSPNPEHFRRLADRMLCDFQAETTRMCHVTNDADKRRHAAEAARIASVISRHLAVGLIRGALF